MGTYMHAAMLHANVHRSCTYAAKTRKRLLRCPSSDGSSNKRQQYIHPRKYHSAVERSTYSYLQRFWQTFRELCREKKPIPNSDKWDDSISITYSNDKTAEMENTGGWQVLGIGRVEGSREVVKLQHLYLYRNGTPQCPDAVVDTGPCTG